MTTVEKRSELLERIQHLNDTELDKVYNFLEESFPDQETSEVSFPKKKRQAGTMKGKIWLSDDWDSDEVNEEIARDSYESKIFPKGD